jgi:hypothetical protein
VSKRRVGLATTSQVMKGRSDAARRRWLVLKSFDAHHPVDPHSADRR